MINKSRCRTILAKIEHKQELQEVVVALIKNGEICGTEFAESLLKIELGEKRIQSLNDQERILAALNNVTEGAWCAEPRSPYL